MNNRQKPTSFQGQAEQIIREEALRVAKATQAPGQTKEQTRLIAKGIEKGIALYKQQQKEKARERDKARKRALRQAQTSEGGNDDAGPEVQTVADASAKPALMAAGAVFLLASLAHVLRWILGWDIAIAGHSFPMAASLFASAVAGGLSAWMFRQAIIE